MASKYGKFKFEYLVNNVNKPAILLDSLTNNATKQKFDKFLIGDLKYNVNSHNHGYFYIQFYNGQVELKHLDPSFISFGI